MIRKFNDNQKIRLCDYFGLKQGSSDDLLLTLLKETDDETFVKSLYYSLLERETQKIDLDVIGIKSWVNNLQRMQRSNVVDHLLASNECKKSQIKKTIFLGPYTDKSDAGAK